MEVRMADHMGMCFGVKDAIDLALGLTQRGPRDHPRRPGP